MHDNSGNLVGGRRVSCARVSRESDALSCRELWPPERFDGSYGDLCPSYARCHPLSLYARGRRHQPCPTLFACELSVRLLFFFFLPSLPPSLASTIHPRGLIEARGPRATKYRGGKKSRRFVSLVGHDLRALRTRDRYAMRHSGRDGCAIGWKKKKKKKK